MFAFLTRIIGVIFGLSLLAFPVLGAQVKEDNYEIYLGDVDGDGDDDFYFQQKPWYLILHGEIATPIQIQNNFAIYNNGGNYSSPVAFSFSAVDLLARVTNGSLKKGIWNQDIFLVAQANGSNTLLIRGAYASSPALLLKSYTSSVFPTVAATYSTATFRGISDRNVTLRIIDVNGDDINDVVLGNFGSTDGEVGYLADGNNIHSQQVTISAGIPAGNGTLVGAIEGQFRVDESGAATYSIPISVPQGVAGVAPQIAINYSSQNGNGLVGYGANISGFGIITRCRQTLLQDGEAKPITWSDQDRFCLNGQRLMLVSGSSYGVPDSTYKTEIDSYIKITAKGGSAGSPDYFEAEAKDGSKTIYGGSSDSKLFHFTKLVHWAQSRFEDNMGNRIDYIFEGDRLTGHRIRFINYAYSTPKVSTGHNASIEFNYSDRADVLDSYSSGGVYLKSTKKLTSLVAYNGSTIFRKYNFFYNEIAFSTVDNLSRLTNVEECTSDSSTSCYPRTRFIWGYKTIGFSPTPSANINKLPGNVKDYRFMDFNGDGRQDLIWVSGSGTSRSIEYGSISGYAYGGTLKQNFSNGTQYLNFTLADTSDAELEINIIDYNNDGRQDLVVCRPVSKTSPDCSFRNLYLSIPNSSGGWSLSSNPISLPVLRRSAMFGDVDSDGVIDAIDAIDAIGSTQVRVFFGKKQSGVLPSSNLYYSLSSAFSTFDISGTPAVPTSSFPPNSPAPSARQRSFDFTKATLGDVNGDGQMDLMIPATTSTPGCSVVNGASTNLCHDSSGGYSSDSRIVELFTYLKSGNEFVFSSAYTVHLGNTTFNNPADVLKNIGFKVQDINNDGLSDLIISGSINWNYRLNAGFGYHIPQSITNISSSTYATTSVNFIDYNQDGYLDVIWQDKQNSKLKLRTWDRATNTMGSDTDLLSSMPASYNYSFGDLTGDGFIDLIQMKDNMDVSIYNGKGDSGTLDKIYQIKDGNNKQTLIDYGSLANSINYTTLSGVNTVATTDSTFCSRWTYSAPCNPPTIYALDSANFYTQLNRPFGAAFEAANPAPVLELTGANYVVTQVRDSAPTVAAPGSLKKVTYHYHHARMQAGGRGYLGFEKISVIDQQSGIRTESTFHQEWPLIGYPKSTIVKTGAGHKLSESINTWAVTADSSNSRISRVEQDTVTEISYELKTNGAAQGNNLQTITTNTDYDTLGYGNVMRLEVVTSGQSNTLTKTTVNTYPSDEWSRRMGRLETATTTTQLNSESAVTRSSKFEYYGKLESWPGMLKKEIIEPGSNQHVTEHEYDAVGNEIITRKTANVKPGVLQARKVEVTYDSSKRFAEITRDGLDNVTSGVIQRHPVYGIPTQIRDVNGVVTIIELNADGSERVRRDASGAGVITERVYCGGSVSCPNHAAIRVTSTVSGGGKSTEYLDVVGRVVRSSKVMFDGRESFVDTEYDIQGRISRKSEPYFSNETVYWTVFNEYDLVNRVIKATAPDGTETTNSYSGYETLSTMDSGTNGKQLTRKEEHNDLGNLVKVTDHAGGTISYGYDPLGNLINATTTSAGQNIVVRMCYDNLGRKIAMHDPDKGGFLGNANEACATIESKLDAAPASKTSGWWFYKYNDFGELIEQTDTKKQVSIMDYDALGRMVTRTDKRSDNSVDVHTRWYYDKYLGDANSKPETQLKLTAVVASYNGINESCSGANYCQTHVYDSFSRITDTATYLPNDSTGYITSVRYDVAGRAYKQYDALNGNVQTSGTRTYFNSYGYAQQINDIATGDVLQKTINLNARGQVKEELRNNGSAGSTVYTYDDATGRLTNQSTNLAGILIPIQNVTYNWDKLGNLKYRWNQSGNLTPSGSTAKKDLRESFCYDGLNRLIKSHAGDLVGSCNLSAAQQDQEYDGFGNITRKVGMGTYSYTGKGPHAVTSTTTTGSYSYDNNGNQTSGGGRTNIAYSTYDQPLTITSANATTHFAYGPDRKRFERKDIKNGKTIITNYLGSVERVQESGSSIVEWKRYIAGAIYTVRTINGAVEKTNKSFIFNDHLGSLDVVTDAVGKVTHSASFNAWGERRSGENWAAAFATSSLSLTGFDRPLTERGYTGHEMLDDHGLIHMNGRIYDPKLARFLQADPFIQAATNTQNYNRYSYVLNNPLNATDPSGHFFVLFVAIMVKVAAVEAAAAAFVIGFAAAAQAYASGASGWRAVGIGIMAGLTAGVSGNAFGGYISGMAQGAIVGGISSAVAGGEFKDGAIGGAIGGLGGAGTGNVYIDFTTSVVLAGAASEATGGKFKNGAATAATYYVLEVGAAKLAFGGNRADPDRNITLTDPEDACDLALVSCSMSYSGGGEIEEYTLTADLSLQKDLETASYFTGIAGIARGAGTALLKQNLVRVRHFTNSKGLDGIELDKIIKASDQNRVFTVKAKGKPGSPRDIEEALGIKPGRGRNYIEFDANPNEYKIVKNSLTNAVEYVFDGDVNLTNRNTKFIKR